MTDHYDVFLSYSHNDLEAATNLRGQLERRGLAVFRDQESIREGELWLNRLQEAVDACGSFVVLVGRDGVRRWVGAETQVALNRYFGPHDDALRLPIFPILLGDTDAGDAPGLPAPVPGHALERRRCLCPSACSSRSASGPSSPSKATFEGCPFVGLDAYRRIRRSCSSAGRRRPWTRSPASTPARAARRSAGSRSTATAAPASPR